MTYLLGLITGTALTISVVMLWWHRRKPRQQRIAGADMASALASACGKGKQETWGWMLDDEATAEAISDMLAAAEIPPPKQLAAARSISDAVRFRIAADREAGKLDEIVGEDGWQRISHQAALAKKAG